jgi:hypothetical protein
MDILPGSFLTGQPIWAVAGAVVAVGAVSMLVVVNFRGGDEPFGGRVHEWQLAGGKNEEERS